VDLSAHDYPPVTHIVMRNKHLRWEQAVLRIDWRRRRIHVRDLDKGVGLDDDPLEKDALLARDVLDALLLDLPNRQTVRANDLWLEGDEKVLEVHAADIGAWAVLRRLGGGRLGRSDKRGLLDWRDVEFLRGDPAAARAGHDYHRRVSRLQPAEIARLLDAMPYPHAAELLELLEASQAADALEVMLPERQVQVFEEFEKQRRTRLLELMAPEHAADLLARLGPRRARANLEALPEQARQAVVDLLRYPDDSAGGIMTNDIVLVESRLRVDEARDAIRERLHNPDFVYYVYVVDSLAERHLEGVVTLRDLLVAEPADRLRDLIQQAVTTLEPLMSANEAAYRVADQHLAALPVVDKTGRIVGAVTADAALLQIAPSSMSGLTPRVFT
ncbi:MAG TPA: CBS domain-containing protein, partial [Chloroflexota bacterium]|nr:CBS domain-containing protein [Chloroflexota bacterium]